MTARRHRFEMIRLASVSSTQEEARRLAEGGCQPGTLVLAEEQTLGRGRGQRSWHSPRGLGIWMTLIDSPRRPRTEWPAWTSAGAFAVCRAIERLDLSPKTKWPNDVLLSGRKVAGVLAETAGEKILLGIGINLLQTVDDLPPELRPIATSIRIEVGKAEGKPTVDRARFLEALLTDLREVLDRFEAEGPGWIVRELWKRSIVRGRFVAIESPAGEVTEGKAIGLGPIGELVVETPDGERTLANGTVRAMEDR